MRILVDNLLTDTYCNIGLIWIVCKKIKFNCCNLKTLYYIIRNKSSLS